MAKKKQPSGDEGQALMQSIVDDALRFQVYTDRFAAGLVADFTGALDILADEIAMTVRALEVDTLGDMSRRQLTSLLSDLRGQQVATYTRQINKTIGQLYDFGTFTGDRERIRIESWATKAAKISDEFSTTSGVGVIKTAPAKQIWGDVLAKPITSQGKLLEPLMQSAASSAVERVEGVVRNGWAQGKTVQEVTREIIGTKELGGGTKAQDKRQAEAVTRTATQHVAATARQGQWEANDDIVQGYQWIATLDNRTSSQCRSLDRKIFRFNQGPVPPLHINCRSTTVPYLGPEFDVFLKGATRSSVNGYVPQSTTYYEWLKTQPRGFIDDALGQKRGQLLMDGGLSPDRFAALNLGTNFEPLTLAQMRKLDEQAFLNAGL